jgi:hypothetical protein
VTTVIDVVVVLGFFVDGAAGVSVLLGGVIGGGDEGLGEVAEPEPGDGFGGVAVPDDGLGEVEAV